MEPNFYVFNGDADGLFAAQQLRLQFGDAPIITGVKRDIQLLKQLKDEKNKNIYVCDISLDKNRESLTQVLSQGCQVAWYDHHFSGLVPEDKKLTTHINQDAHINSSAIVYQSLGMGNVAWAIAGLFGDNMAPSANALAQTENYPKKMLESLKELGQLVNYNAYGASLKDLIINPAEIFATMVGMASPEDLIEEGHMISKLRQVYQGDVAAAKNQKEVQRGVLILPNEPWAARTQGDLAYQLQADHPGKAVTILIVKGEQNYQVSLRVPENCGTSAAEFSMKYPTGGGRKTAAGINELPTDKLESFLQDFTTTYQ
ncbi:MAG: DHH family phosphoesterase [SAR324 cluster bacterium]|nr:DHH family phosphoesterase [SAR324 cluster bacterium]